MTKQLTLGWHTSISPSIIDGIKFNQMSHKICDSKYKISAQIFLKNPMRVSKCKFIQKDFDIVKNYIEENDIYLVVHGQYLINFIKTDIDWALKSVIDDIKILDKMTPDNKKNENFYKNVKEVITKTEDCKVKLILETSTKTKNGNDIFNNIETFGKLKIYLQSNLSNNEYSRIGYCIDTAHIFASGYDITTKSSFENFIDLWDKNIGINEITLFHLNDSKVGLGCCRDLHEQIGSGLIFSEQKEGLNTLLEFCKNLDIPIIIESGGNQDEELKLIQQLIKIEN